MEGDWWNSGGMCGRDVCKVLLLLLCLRLPVETAMKCVVVKVDVVGVVVGIGVNVVGENAVVGDEDFVVDGVAIYFVVVVVEFPEVFEIVS